MAKKQGRNARLDESLGVRRGKESTKKQSYKSRRDESRGATNYKVGGPVPETNDSLAAKGYQGGGVLMPPSRPRIQDFMGGVAGGPPKRRPNLGPQPRRRRGPGLRGRDV